MNLEPWLEKPYRELVNRRHTLPHGLLLTGLKGSGKLSLARELAKTLLCLQGENGLACDHCTACHLFSVGNHPDYHLLTTDEQNLLGDAKLFGPAARYLVESNRRIGDRVSRRRIISVEQVRKLLRELDSTPHLGRAKVIVVCPADQMNLHAANALLKSLEEPTPDTYFVLITALPLRLPATIRSRCIHLRITLPDEQSLLSWLGAKTKMSKEDLVSLLMVAGGSPLTTIDLRNDDSSDLYLALPRDLSAIVEGQNSPTDLARKWKEGDIHITARWLQRQIFVAIRSGLGGTRDYQANKLFDYLGQQRCFALYDDLGLFLQWPSKAIDETLFLESVINRLFEPAMDPGSV